jgi:protein-disulfide isomerase
MSEWCRAMEINATPTFFINQHQLPDAYSIEDLENFLLE